MTQTRDSLTREVWKYNKNHRREDIRLEDVEDIINDFLKGISAALIRGERIEMRFFGVFEARYRKPHIGRDPRLTNSKPIEVSGRYAVKFSASKALKELLNARRT